MKNDFSNNAMIKTGANHAIHNFQSSKPNNEQNFQNFKIKGMSKGKFELEKLLNSAIENHL